MIITTENVYKGKTHATHTSTVTVSNVLQGSVNSVVCFCLCSTLLEMTCQVANVLKKDGVKKGDRVAIYMPVSPMLVASMLACARIGVSILG